MASTPSSSSSASAPRGSIGDYRSNVERQAREQKSVGGMMAMIVYGLAGCFVFAALLATYGAYTISRQMHQQSVTLTDLDSRYTAENQALTAQLKASNDTLTDALTQTQAQLKREQEVILRQQDSLNKLTQSDTTSAAALKQERAARLTEEISLRARIRYLETQPRSNR